MVVPRPGAYKGRVHDILNNNEQFIALTDVNEAAGSTQGERTVPSGSAAWLAQVVPGMLNCNGSKMAEVTDGTSNTLLASEVIPAKGAVWQGSIGDCTICRGGQGFETWTGPNSPELCPAWCAWVKCLRLTKNWSLATPSWLTGYRAPAQ